MFPLRDSVHTHKFSFVTYALIAINVWVFLMELNSPDLDQFIYIYGLVPSNIDFGNLDSLKAFISSQFLHAGFLHIISNMWFLKIFGDNVEERFGSLKYLIIYLLCGVAGGLLQYAFSPNSDIPMIGASGAVAGILGAYFVFFPHHKIETVLPIGFFVSTVDLPASAMLIYWFLTQILSGVGTIGIESLGGVAFWAHIGGFVAGYLAARFFSGKHITLYQENSDIDY